MYRIEFLPSAARALGKLGMAARRRVAGQIEKLAQNPRPPGVRKLVGSSDVWRIRVGEYRVLYQIEDDRLVILVVEIAHRREAYRS